MIGLGFGIPMASQIRRGGAAASIRLGTAISSRAGLEALDGEDGFYYLTADIDLSGSDWVPIDFHGDLDLNGHTISNMNVSATSASGKSSAGFMASTQGACVRNGKFLNCTTDIGAVSTTYKAILAGGAYYLQATNLVFENCTVNSGGGRSGAVVGFGQNCGLARIVADVTSTGSDGDFTGAIVGHNTGLPGDVLGLFDCWYNSDTWTHFDIYVADGVARTESYLTTAANYTSGVWNPAIFDITDGQFPGFQNLAYTEVATRAELEAALASGGTVSDLIMLAADIDLSGSNWPRNSTSFAGLLDGNGYKITGLLKPTMASTEGGLFDGSLGRTAEIRNLYLDVDAIGSTSSDSAGYQGPIATAGYLVASNTITRGSIYGGGDRVGGFVGYITGIQIHKCVAACNVLGDAGTRDGAFVAFTPGNVSMSNSSRSVNCSGYTGATQYDDEPLSDVYVADNTAAHTPATWTNRYFSAEIWDIQASQLPDFQARS